MNAAHFLDFIFRSLGAGLLACLLMIGLRCTAHRVRMVVITAVWPVMALIAFDCLVPLPRFQVWEPAHGTFARSDAVFTMQAVMIAWFAGACLVLARDAARLHRLRLIIQDAEPIIEPSWLNELEKGRRAFGIKTSIDLRWTDQLGPCAAGWLRPVILLPRTASDWSNEMRAQVLTHELAHFQRRDLWMLLAVRLIAAAHWFNPCIFVLRRWMEFEREQACDALVVRHRGDAVAYAESLLALAVAPSPAGPMPALTLLSRRRSQVEDRICELLRGNQPRPAVWQWIEGISAAVAILLLVACSVSGPVTSATDKASITSEVELRLSADPFPAEP
jgi:beta-lactamase regulating signal transducer with metallopeptidase domain